MLFEVHSDCAGCRVQGAVIETWDMDGACGRLGVPAQARCRLCARTCVGEASTKGPVAAGEGCPQCGQSLDDPCRDAHRCPFCGASAGAVETQRSRAFVSAAELERALHEWSEDEGHSSATELLASSFVIESIDALHAAMARGEIVETTFDVADFLFASSGSTSSVERAPVRERPRGEETTLRQERVSLSPHSVRRYGGPREELLALASVAAADGEANEADRIALMRAAEQRGIPALEAHDIRVFRPNEIDPPPTLLDRERVLEEMFQMAWADGQLDESELRVIRDFGRVWGIDPARLAEWIQVYSFGDANRFDRWLRRLAQFVFPEK